MLNSVKNAKNVEIKKVLNFFGDNGRQAIIAFRQITCIQGQLQSVFDILENDFSREKLT